ncbi:MAG: PHP domain-containing protein [Candidatus Nanohaloarchaea archaeon]
MKHADLHTHSTHSDGTDTVEKVVETARERGIDCVAVTDHDTLHRENDERVKEAGDVELINAAEIKCEIEGEKIEILSYFLETSDPELQDLVEKIDRLRRDRMEEMVRKLNDEIESEVLIGDVEEKAEGPLARPHLARVLVDKGEAGSVSEAFEKYIAEDRPAYVPTKKLKAGEVIETVHENGGATSLAHPGRSLTRENADRLVGKLAETGLDGIEVRYSYGALDRDHEIEINFREEKAGELADGHDLIRTGGSDSHGTESEKDYVGNVELPYSQVEKMKERARSRGSEL